MLGPIQSILCFDAMVRATRLNGSFAVSDLVHDDLREDAIRGYIRFCMQRKAVEIVPERATVSGRHVMLYRVIADLPPVHKVGDDAAIVRKMMSERLFRRQRDIDLAEKQKHLWTAIRALRVVEARSLAFHASTEAAQISVDLARRYLSQLAQGGYLHAEGENHYRLVVAKNTGPFPVAAHRGILFDFNLMQAVNVTAQSPLQHAPLQRDGRAA